MYPSNNHQKPMGNQPGLTRYVSAPSSLLSNLVDSVIGNDEEFSGVGSETLLNRYFSGDSSSISTESSCKERNGLSDPNRIRGLGTLERSYGLNQIPVVGGGGGGSSSTSPSPLIRQSSSPAGFFKNLNVENGFCITNGMGGGGYKYSHGGANGNGGHGRLNPQLSFTRQDSLSQISEVGESIAGASNSDDGHGNAGQSYISGSFTMSPWDDSNEIVFSNPSKRAKTINGDIITGLSDIESQSLFNLPKTSSEMTNMEKLLQMQSDSVPCRIRAKRGFATHPRSIAERERRGRISDNLRKLQELVPNMDKQTSTADMLDLAVQHIKGLQGDVKKLNKDIENCSCGCKTQGT